jgi:drug/metabolite transporter (DMT)-like permease
MAARTLLLILLSVCLSSIAQLTLKTGMSSPRMAAALAGEDRLAAALTVATAPLVILGLALYGIGAVVWLFVLAKTDVSVAYPFVGLGFIVTMAFGAAMLGEQVGALRLLGTLLVGVGVYLVARS